MKYISALGGVSAAFAAFLLPLVVSAHEVYVLTPDEIKHDVAEPPFSMWQTLLADVHLFAFWAFISILVVIGVFFISISRVLENWLDPIFAKLAPYAPVVSRVTIGISFLAAAIYQANYGPELPIHTLWGSYSPILTVVLVLLGLCTIFGFATRVAALIALALYLVNVYFHGGYMLTYLNYFGEIVVLLILGAHKLGAGYMSKAKEARRGLRGSLSRIADKLAPYSFLVLRVCFGISLLYASLYAKFLHNNLALDVAAGHGLLPSIAPHAMTVAQSLGFEPHFLVLGAGIIEIVIALFFILGIEIRFTSIFLEIWLALSLWYFGEIVWPHLILIGIPIAFIFYGYDKYSLEGYFFKRGKREPVL